MFDTDRLPYLLRRDTIARIDGERLLIGDRRRFPFERCSVPCTTIAEVASALKQMVTQGGGPLQVALTAMRFVARRCAAGAMVATVATFEAAAAELAAARRTNTTMARTLQRFTTALKEANPDGTLAPEQVDVLIDHLEQSFDRDYDAMSDYGADLLVDGDSVLTTCFAEHSFLMSLIKARDAGKQVSVLVSETRPYLQGARLTAPSLQELGIPCELITDGMGSHALADGKANRYMTAADVVAMDGSVANKTGTLANAISAKAFGLPYHVLAMSPDPTKSSSSDFELEWRDGNELLKIGDQPVTLASIAGWYPAFDVIDHSLVTGIVTPQGIFTFDTLAKQYIGRPRQGGTG